MRKLVIAIMAVFALLYMNPIDGYCAPNSVEGLESLGTVTYSYTGTMNYNDFRTDVTVTYYNGVNEGGTISGVADNVYVFNVDNSSYDFKTYLDNPQPLTFITVGTTSNMTISYEMKKVTDFEDAASNESTTYGTLVLQTSSSCFAKDIIENYEKSEVLMEYAKQFLYDNATIEDFIKYFKTGNGSNICIYSYVTLASNKETYPGLRHDTGCASLDLIAGLIPQEEHTGYYSNFDKYSLGTESEALPYLFVSPNDKDGIPNAPYMGDIYDNGKDFICYREHKKPFASLSSHREASSVFTWVVEDYPEFSECFIEIRSVLLEGNDITGYKPMTNDYYYYSSVDGSLKKEEQETLALVPFSAGTYTCSERDMGDYYLNIEQFKNIATSCPIRMQVRVISADKSLYSNWITFDFDLSGQNLKTGALDDDGNVVIDGIDNIPGYDWDKDKNSGKYGYAFDNQIEDWDADFQDYLNNALGDVIAFPTLINIVYGWLPDNIITLVAISIGLLICLRILGR